MSTPSVAQTLAQRVAALESALLPEDLRATCEDLLIDVGGLCVAARNSDYMKAVVASVDGGGACTAIGHAGSFSASDAAMINGMLAHADETDDSHAPSLTHPGCAIVPAALAMAERKQCDGMTLLGAEIGRAHV